MLVLLQLHLSPSKNTIYDIVSFVAQGSMGSRFDHRSRAVEHLVLGRLEGFETGGVGVILVHSWRNPSDNCNVLALSIRQPFAELILRGIKTAELRSRATNIVGERFYIYASRTPARR